MGSSTLLDYALFQLTPTRTRCDLILFYGGKTEKLASGLFEPFISHLKFAKDQISRGGYSIKLSPPTSYAPWFTKATFERFVRFVSTPAVLERFVILEREIQQIQSSAQNNGFLNSNVAGQLEEATSSVTRKSSDSAKLKGELERINSGETPEENSKIQLQRVLETRKTLLRKEQAMAYARGLVAGFEADSIDDLISFADEFGASRLRDACIDFKELCKKKHGDGLWMQELAAMEACPPAELSFLGTSGIVLNSDACSINQTGTLNLSSSRSRNASKSDSIDDNLATSDQMPSTTTKVQMPMPWPNQIPQYMYNFQNPVPPYQGYPFPPIPPHYAMNMQWPSNLKESGSMKKELLSNRKGHRDSEEEEEEEETESSNSELGSDSDSYVQQDRKRYSTDASNRKKHRKRSSKTVVIRNINYITPKRRNGDSHESFSDENDFIDEDSLRQQVNEAVGSLEKLPKSNSSSQRRNGLHRKNGDGSAVVEDSNDPSEVGRTKDNWDTLQNLLVIDGGTTNGGGSLHSKDVQDEQFTLRSSGDGNSLAIVPSMDFESEKVPKRQAGADDSFVATQRDGGSVDIYRLEDIDNAEICEAVMKRRDSTDGELVIPLRTEQPGSGFRGIVYETESSAIKPRKGEDWFVINHTENPENQNSSNMEIIFDGHRLNNEKSKKDSASDDSLMMHDRRTTGDLYDSQWKTDVSMAADLVLFSETENSTGKENHERKSSCEPDDLYVVLERNSEFETARGSWTADHGIESIDISVMETDTRRPSIETGNNANKNLPDSTVAKKKVPNGKQVPGKDVKPKIPPGYLGNTKSGMLSRTKKPSTRSRPVAHKNKLEQEDEIRKRMEELVIQRQKRIAERTAASGGFPAATKKTSESKQVKGSLTRTVRRQTI